MNIEPTLARGDRPLILLEIGSDRLKLMRTVPARRGPGISHLHFERIESLADDLGGRVARVINAWPDHAHTPVILCLPRQMVTIRNIELPSTEPAEIDDMIAIQTAKLTPWSRDEILADYRLLNSDKPGYSRVMLVIAQRSALRQRFYIAEEAGLEPERLTIGTEGLLCWATAKANTGENLVVLDVDSFFTDFLMVRDGEPVFSRAILTGANAFETDPATAAAKLAGDVAQSLELAGRENDAASPTRILLTGASAPADALAAAVREQTGLACEVCDPLADGALTATVAAATADDRSAASLTALVGMAAEPQGLDINLIPESVRARRTLGRRARVFSGVGLAVMAVLVSASFLANVRYFARRDQLRTLRDQVTMTSPASQRVERIHAIADQARGYLDPRMHAATLLDALHAVIPPDVSLEQFDLDVEQQRLVLSGSAPAIRDVRTMVGQLEATDRFQNVREDGAMSQDTRTGRFKFKIVCPLEVEA